MDGGACWAAVHGVARSWIQLSDFTFTFHFHALEKEMATHSSVLAWRIPGMGEPGGLPCMGSHRVRHDWNDLAAASCFRRACLHSSLPHHLPSSCLNYPLQPHCSFCPYKELNSFFLCPFSMWNILNLLLSLLVVLFQDTNNLSMIFWFSSIKSA